ncbi:hypothetical protein FRC03_002502 [Tulasnella sp. 419]|nr:hypothetical protein FRC03_002502 [Tulasnella sp. 419]
MSSDSPSVFHTYTQNPEAAPTAIFPNHGMQILTTVVYLLGISVTTYCIARRSGQVDFSSIQGLISTPWPRICTIIVFIFSWIFIFIAAILISGAGLSYSLTTCSLAIWSCIIIYVCSKLFIYLFLIEKVYIVWNSHGSAKPLKRLRSPVFRICMLILTPLIGIFALVLIGRVAELRSDRACVIGLTKVASMSLLAYDLFITIFLTSLFVWPLWRATVNPRLRRVASRTLIASLAALTTSAINIAVLTVMHGKQLGWVCLTSCGTDVTVNALVLYWVTNVGSTRSGDTTNATSGQTPQAHSSGDIKSNTARNTAVIGLSNLEPGTPGLQTPRVDRRRTTFAEPSFGSANKRTSEMRVEHGRKGSGSFWKGLVDVVRPKDQVVEEHCLSVQVTVTTDIQEDTNPVVAKYDSATDTSQSGVKHDDDDDDSDGYRSSDEKPKGVHAT